MRELRNPFRMRTSEHIESDSTFLRLFSPHVVSCLPDGCLDPGILRVQSSPGGGKTSLFRLFTPGPLVSLWRSRANEENRELYDRLCELGAMTDEGPDVMGVLLSCAHNYSRLEDLSLGSGIRERYFYALMNARLMLASIRAALAFKGFRYPDGLSKLSFSWPNSPYLPENLAADTGGMAANRWACSVEESVYSAIDSLDDDPHQADGHQALYVPGLLTPLTVLFDGHPIASHILVMLDDVHKLSSNQRCNMLQSLADMRPPIPVWVAERLEVLQLSDLIPTGVTLGREFREVLNLETQLHGRQLELVLSGIADRRTHIASDVDIGSFKTWLPQTADDSESQRLYSIAAESLKSKKQKVVEGDPEYSRMFGELDRPDANPRDVAIRLQSMDIMVEREARSRQPLLVESPANGIEPEKYLESDVKHAAEVFIHHQFGTPYYFGMTRLAYLSSSNIEQFLSLAGDLFEEMISQSLLRRHVPLLPMRQQAIIQKTLDQKWADMMRRVPYGSLVKVFLDRLGAFAQAETYQPNAPYSPGVTGFALSMADRECLVDQSSWVKHPGYKALSSVLSSCLAFNLLEAHCDQKQGTRPDRLAVLYLNRWLCVRYDLPLSYGGWRHKPLGELVTWLRDEPSALVSDRGGLS